MKSEISDTDPPGQEQTTPPQQSLSSSVVATTSTTYNENAFGNVAANQLAFPKQEDDEGLPADSDYNPVSSPRPSLEPDSQQYIIISDSESEPEATAYEVIDLEDDSEEGGVSDVELQAQSKEDSTKPNRSGKPQGRPRSRKTKQKVVNIEISQAEKEMSMELGLRHLIRCNYLTHELHPSADDDQGDEFEASDEVQSLGENDEEPSKDIDDYLKELPVTGDAPKSSTKPVIPNSTHTHKRKALREIARAAIEKNPTVNRREVFKDSKSIERATRLFTHVPHMDGTGHWKMGGMKSNLYHYQVQAIGWMRKRERSRGIIRGGILADIMGLGKTITALATILDGKRQDLNKTRAPTLIIVPSQLVSNWKRQLTNHFHLPAFGAVRYYTKDMNSEFDDNINGLGVIDVVVATYEDVRKSYPPLKPPKDINTEEKLKTWWLINYEPANYGDSVGLLHKVQWHRILIDEGHVIRNHWSHISVAVRALTGGLKWIVTGTPLHNGVQDFFPYFNFLKVPQSKTYEEFEDSYCKEGPEAKARLIATIRPFFRRKTWASTLFGLPIVTMHGLKEEDVVVEFCRAERIIYDTLVRIYREKINKLARCKRAQENCIWLMIIRLRLFSSHPLTAQGIVQHLLKSEEIRASLEILAQCGAPLDPASTELMQFFDFAKKIRSRDLQAAIESQQSEIERRTALGDKAKLTQHLRKTTRECWDNENWRGYHERVDQACALCNEHFDPAFILTSCAHLYCGDCFKSLPDEHTIDTGTPVCCRCNTLITEAVVLGAIDESGLDEGLPSSPAPGAKRRKNLQSQKSKRAKATGMFQSRSNGSEDRESGETSDEENEDIDLIPFVGNFHSRATLLGSKLTKARDLIQKWMNEDSSNKIVVFTHFLSSLRLLELMCQEHKWEYTKLCGKTPMPARDLQIKKFQEKEQVKVMLSTMNTGSVGIDLTAANKSILLDLWWNMAVEEQAEFRLFRLGQTREVHCVKLIAKGTREAEMTIDQKMLSMQHAKMENIQGVIGTNALTKPVEQVLECLGHVERTENGGYRITRGVPAEESNDQAQGTDALPDN